MNRTNFIHAQPDFAADADGQPAERFVNRELSWLEFNRRVLHEAMDERTPLLERINFLSIFTSNLDEFFMKRVGGLKRQIAAGVRTRSLDGLTPEQQLVAIRKAVLPQLGAQAACFAEQINPALQSHGIHLLAWSELSERDIAFTRNFFRRQVFPALTPLAVDPGHPFPLISNLSDSLGIVLRSDPATEPLFARVKVPALLPRWIQLPDGDAGRYRFVRLVDMIRNNLHDLFVDMEVLRVMPFRITRNTDVERDEEDAEDLLEMIEDELRARRFAEVVRLEYGPNPDPWILQRLIDELRLTDVDLYELRGELDYTDLKPIADLPLPQLKVPLWNPIVPPAFADRDTDLFALIRNGDVLVHHPFDSFTATVERFIEAAVDDPEVLAIKMTLYRTGDDSPFVKMLIRAAESGKQVVCLVELKARFDEQRNIRCAQMLENAGVHVVYGVVGFKTHTKTALVVRREPDGLRSYAHIGTGNYHPGTSRLYTDLGLLTAQPEITDELVALFNYLTGRSRKCNYRRLLVAPVNMRSRILQLIDREIENHQQGRPAAIIGKMNSLEDKQVIEALYRASQAGVKIDLIVRGFCSLRPGVAGMSENISVISIVGRFLEHSRIFHFRNGADDPADGEYFIGSADWMSRNLDYRVEAVTPIDARPLREQLWNILRIMLNDQRQTWVMQSDGSYVQRTPSDPAQQLGTHEILMQQALSRQRSIGEIPSAPAPVSTPPPQSDRNGPAEPRTPEPERGPMRLAPAPTSRQREETPPHRRSQIRSQL